MKRIVLHTTVINTDEQGLITCEYNSIVYNTCVQCKNYRNVPFVKYTYIISELKLLYNSNIERYHEYL